MQAMILAAGLGTRIRTYNNSVPKPLIEVDGQPLLQRVILRLKDSGITNIVINTHYLAEQIEAFITKHNFGVEIVISHEPKLLGIAGGIVQASHYFDPTKPILFHNPDEYTEFDLATFYRNHNKDHAGTLAVHQKPNDRPFLVTTNNLIVGHRNKNTNVETLCTEMPIDTLTEKSFCGIYVLSQQMITYIKAQHTNESSIVNIWLKAIKAGMIMLAYDIGDSLWYDVGTPEDMQKLSAKLSANKYD